MLRALCDRWWCLLLRGLTAVAAGVVALAYPGLTAYVLAVLIGISALVDGAMCVVVGFRPAAGSKPWWEMVALGLVGVGFGLAAVAWPGIFLATLIVLVGIWAVARGVLEIAVAVRLRKLIDDEWLLAVSGALSLAFGILLLSKPIEGIVVIGLLIGLFLLAGGLAATALALRLRAVRKRLSET